MAAKHPTPEPAPEPAPGAPPPTAEEAEATIRASLDVAWGRRFHVHTTTDGSTEYVDVQTGQTYTELPNMHSKDGRSL